MNLETRPHRDVIDSFHPPDNGPVRWHPKITIYRLVVLLTTICLGVGKVMTSARGAVLVPVTPEWVSGVAAFVLRVVMFSLIYEWRLTSVTDYIMLAYTRRITGST